KDETPKLKGGWPKGKPRKTLAEARGEPAPVSAVAGLKAKGPGWSDRFGDISRFQTPVGVDWAPSEQADTLNIDAELVQALACDGISLQWGTHEIRGMPARDQVTAALRGGWQFVHVGDLNGALDHLTNDAAPGDVVRQGDSVLMARPTAITEKARQHQ